MKTSVESIHEYLKQWSGHPFDACLSIAEKMDNESEEQWKILQETLKWISFGNTEAALEETTNDEIEWYSFHYQGYLDELVEVLMASNPSQDDFYKILYNKVFESDILLKDIKSKAMYLYILYARIKQLPYYQTSNCLIMSNEDYKKTVQNITPQINMAFHIQSRKFDSKTERVSQYYEIASTLKNRDDQIVFWTIVLEIEKKKNET